MNTTESIVTLDLPRSHYDAVYALAIMRELSLNDALALLITEGFNAIETNSLIKKTIQDSLIPIESKIEGLTLTIDHFARLLVNLPHWEQASCENKSARDNN